ncbi:MAG: CBS domain-containing protein [Thermoplasmata archaeon]|nr:CBS domain-containing protein [Thermoplasmata archaeon]
MAEKISDIMTKNPILLVAPASRNEALKIMVKNNITGLPVVDENKKYLGMITRRDIFEKPKEDQIALIMREDAPTISPNEDVKKGAELFIKTKRRHIAVIDDKRKVVGIVTPYDYLKLIYQKKIQDPVEKFIKNPCILVHQSTPLKVVFKMITLTKINAFPVVDDDANLVGVITDRDIFENAKVEMNESTSQLGLGEDEDSWTWEGMRNILKILYVEEKIELPKSPVSDVMVKEPVSILNKSPAYRAAKIMIDNNFSQLPVRDSYDSLVAMLYDTDLLEIFKE